MADPRARISLEVEVQDTYADLSRGCCRRVWAQWFTRHGVDPAPVLALPLEEFLCGGFVHRDLENRRVVFRPFLRKGVVLDATGPMVWQLEAAPSRFPWCEDPVHDKTGDDT